MQMKHCTIIEIINLFVATIAIRGATEIYLLFLLKKTVWLSMRQRDQIELKFETLVIIGK